MSDTEKKLLLQSEFFKLAALMTSTITYALHWLSNYKKLCKVLIYSKIFYFALAFQIKLFLKCSSSAAALMLCSLQETETSTLIFFPLFYAASSLYKTIIQSCCFILYKNKHIWFVHKRNHSKYWTPTDRKLKIHLILSLTWYLYLNFHSASSLYSCRKPDFLSVQQCSLSNKELLNNREKQ